MARRTSPTLTDAELKLMRVIWKRGPSKVGEVVEALPEEESVAYSTVLTTLRILENKGYLRHRKQGRAYVYEAIVQPGQVRKDVLRYVMDRFFDDSASLLVLNLIEDEQLEGSELQRIRELIDGEEQS